jgi:acyl-CoA synthetase (NDP forming)
MTEKDLDVIFNPRSVAVVGATENEFMFASSYMHHFETYGYKGDVYPINPKRPTIFGYKAYPDLKSVPGNVDYVIYCVDLNIVPELLPEYAQKGVKGVHLFSGRAAETGRKEGIELEQNIQRVAKQYGIRLIGPNCMGIYNPRVGLSNGWDFSKEAGSVSAVLQSGGMSQDLALFGSLRGMRFSKVVSYGNAIDLNECDFLEYFAQDPETKVIMCYVEGVRDGKKFFKVLRQTAQMKPVIILKGGRTKAGNKAAASHTASLAGASNVWTTLINQAGAIMATSFEDWINLGVGFSMVPPIRGVRVGITGGGGGHGVLNADACEESGFDVIPIPESIRQQIKEKAPIIWDWVTNPVDVSIMRGSGINNGEVLMMMAEHPDFDFLIGQISEDTPSSQEAYTAKVMVEYEAYTQIFKANLKPIVVVLGDRSLGIEELSNWRWQLFAQVRSGLVNAKLPFFSTIGTATRVVKQIVKYYQKRPNSQ